MKLVQSYETSSRNEVIEIALMATTTATTISITSLNLLFTFVLFQSSAVAPIWILERYRSLYQIMIGYLSLSLSLSLHPNPALSCYYLHVVSISISIVNIIIAIVLYASDCLFSA